VSIDWSPERRGIFRLALQKSYTDYDDLEMFVDEKLDENLANISEKAELSKVAFKLLQWARSEGRLDELLLKFCDANPRVKDDVIADLQRQPLVNRNVKLLATDWEDLFAGLDLDDFVYGQVAFFQAFKAVYDRSFQETRPDRPLINQMSDIQNLLTQYDNSTLAVRFVECTIAELRRENRDRDLSRLEQWCNRMTQQYQVPARVVKPVEMLRQGYLLVTCEEIGSDVIVYPELRITGEENPVPFGVSLIGLLRQRRC
jgi:hypothetical protein